MFGLLEEACCDALLARSNTCIGLDMPKPDECRGSNRSRQTVAAPLAGRICHVRHFADLRISLLVMRGGQMVMYKP